MANRYNDMGRVDKEVSALFFYCPNIFAYKYFEMLSYKLFICENDLRVFLF